jgi:glycine/D-amino acid oxidase-like deaminating enzyme
VTRRGARTVRAQGDLVDAGEGTGDPTLFAQGVADQPGDVGVEDQEQGAPGADRLR